MNYEDLYAGISGVLSKEIEVLLETSNLNELQKAQAVKLFNESYIEGCHSVSPTYMKDSDKLIVQENEKFMNTFFTKLEDAHNNLNNGKDNSTPETTPKSA